MGRPRKTPVAEITDAEVASKEGLSVEQEATSTPEETQRALDEAIEEAKKEDEVNATAPAIKPVCVCATCVAQKALVAKEVYANRK